MSTKYKEYKRKWRRMNKPYRNKTRKANYAKSRPKVRRRIIWEAHEINLIMTSPTSDRVLAQMLKRSVQAIQCKRSLLRRQE